LQRRLRGAPPPATGGRLRGGGAPGSAWRGPATVAAAPQDRAFITKAERRRGDGTVTLTLGQDKGWTFVRSGYDFLISPGARKGRIMGAWMAMAIQ
jgi:hypothetical protein